METLKQAGRLRPHPDEKSFRLIKASHVELQQAFKRALFSQDSKLGFRMFWTEY